MHWAGKLYSFSGTCGITKLTQSRSHRAGQSSIRCYVRSCFSITGRRPRAPPSSIGWCLMSADIRLGMFNQRCPTLTSSTGFLTLSLTVRSTIN
jgi:hypothetical protein